MDAIGDIDYVSTNEMYNYTPGFREQTAGWRETGHMLRSNNLFYSIKLLITMKIQLLLLLEDSSDTQIEVGCHTGTQFQLGREESKSSMYLCLYKSNYSS